MRDRFLNIIVNVSFIFLITALFCNQIIRFNYYAGLSKNNSIRIIPIDGPRGDIFDRSGAKVVASRLCFDIAVIYNELKSKNNLIKILSKTLNIKPDVIARSLDRASRRPYAAVTIVEDIEKEKALILDEMSSDLNGLIIETRSIRNYPYGTDGAHIFGYLGEITEEELEGLDEYGYRMKDLVGRSGIEKYYDIYLRGASGGTQIEVDNRGRSVRVLGVKEPVQGKDLYLTIDMDIQSACDRLLGTRPGAIVVMNPKTGEVLALSSHPPFDPNIFVRSRTSFERLRLVKDKKGRPLSNRAISGLYPPGSVFKIVTSAAALETKKINEHTGFMCPGYYILGNKRFNCWKDGGHGMQEIGFALMNSCNVFFYNTGRLLGADNLEAFAKLFGFGKVTGIDLPDEVKGIVPGRLWKRINRKDNWYEGETLNYAIGQGYLMVTPIQVLDMMAVMANKGNLVRPFIVKRIGDTTISGTRQKNIGLSDRTIRIEREGLLKVVNDEHGTGKRAKVKGLAVAGKTGTAENPLGKTHAWFAGFAPFDDPDVCLVVFLEHGGKGGITPAEIAGGIFETVLSKGHI